MNTLLLILQLICIVLAIAYFYSALNARGSKKSVIQDNTKEVCRLAQLREVHLTQPLSEKTRPVAIDDIVGQEQAIRALRAALCSSNPQHIIIYGPPGVGKTAAARVILDEAKKNPLSPFKSNAPFVEMDATTLQFDERSIADPLIGSVHDPIYQGAGAMGNAGIPQPKEGAVTKAHGGVLFIDEIGELHPYQMNRLLKVLEDRKVFFNSSYYSSENKNIPLYIHDIFKNGLPADFRLIGATTRSPEEIPPAIRSRCCEIFFKPLKPGQVKKIAENAIKKTGISYKEDFLEEISRYSANGRDTVGLVEKCVSLARLDKYNYVNADILKEAAESSRYHKMIKRHISGEKYIGRINGLAVSGVQGLVMDIEASAIKAEGKGQLKVCGLSEQEQVKSPTSTLLRKSTALASVENAVTLIQHMTGIDPRDYIIHLNFTGGQVVDGPSAGIAIFCCIYSAIFNVPISDKIALTGEISIKGRVLPVGGVEEKAEGAYLNGIERVIIPKDNYNPQLENIGVEIIPVEFISQVLESVFGKEEERSAM